jgi:hypothetical protein
VNGFRAALPLERRQRPAGDERRPPQRHLPHRPIIFPHKTVWIYYGCADTCTGLAIGHLDEIIAFTKENSF